jgi:hypothetical protein
MYACPIPGAGRNLVLDVDLCVTREVECPSSHSLDRISTPAFGDAIVLIARKFKSGLLVNRACVLPGAGRVEGSSRDEALPRLRRML